MSKKLLNLLLVCFMLILTTQKIYATEEIKGLSISAKEIIERLTRLEEGQKALRREMDGLRREMDGLREEINGLRSIMLAGFGILFAGMFAMIGFVIWDRRTALSPAVSEIKELKERQTKLEELLKLYSKKSPELANILKSLKL